MAFLTVKQLKRVTKGQRLKTTTKPKRGKMKNFKEQYTDKQEAQEEKGEKNMEQVVTHYGETIQERSRPLLSRSGCISIRRKQNEKS